MTPHAYYLLQKRLKQSYVDLIESDQYSGCARPDKKSKLFKQLCDEINRIDKWLEKHPLRDEWESLHDPIPNG